MLVFSFFCADVVAVVVALITITLAYYRWTFQYWQRRNLPFLEPKFPFGNSANPLKRTETVGHSVKRHYDNIKSRGWKHAGLFMVLKPIYMAVDLDMLKNVMAKDFQHFTDRGLYYNEKDDPLSANLFAIGGHKWRTLRTKLTPTFTTGKMKMMFQTLLDCTPNLLEKIETDRLEETPINIKEVLGCFTTDIIGSCAFGLDCNTTKDENSPFRVYGRKAVAVTPKQMLKIMFSLVFPNLALRLKVTQTPQDVSDFFLKVVKDTYTYREQNRVTRADFMQLLIDSKNKTGEEALTIEEVAAQSFVFFLAGFETSSTTMTFALYELARRPDIQQKVRDEVNTVLAKYDGKISYDAIQEMKYMDQVLNETLRLYPPVSFLTRTCVKDYNVPGEDVIIEKGTSVMIPVLAIHLDPEYYPEPYKFDPDRFTEEKKKSRHQYAHIPFGEGPRICIGMRFGLMQSKVGLATLLKHYRFTVNERTLDPLKFKPSAFVLTAEGEVWLDAEKI